jgi:hypothetical protein
VAVCLWKNWGMSLLVICFLGFFSKHMAFKNTVYSLLEFLIAGSTNDDTSLDWKGLVTCWNLRVCVLIKWGTSLLVICFLWISLKYVDIKNVVYSL